MRIVSPSSATPLDAAGERSARRGSVCPLPPDSVPLRRLPREAVTRVLGPRPPIPFLPRAAVHSASRPNVRPARGVSLPSAAPTVLGHVRMPKEIPVVSPSLPSPRNPIVRARPLTGLPEIPRVTPRAVRAAPLPRSAGMARWRREKSAMQESSMVIPIPRVVRTARRFGAGMASWTRCSASARNATTATA